MNNTVDLLSNQTISGIKSFISPINIKNMYFSNDLSFNVIIGTPAPSLGGINNFSMGYQSGFRITTGNNNTLVGLNAGRNVQSGFNNTFFGSQCAFTTSTGSWNSAYGRFSLVFNLTGNSNCSFGYSALYNNLSGGNNCAFGNNALLGNTVGINNTAIGYNSFTSGNFSYSTSIGASSSPTDNHQIMMGTNAEYVFIPNYIKYSDGTTQNTAPIVRQSFIGTVSNLSPSSSPYVNLITDASNNYLFDFGLIQGATGATGPTGPTGADGADGSDGGMPFSDGGTSGIVSLIIGLIVSICTTLISDAIMSALGATTIAALQTELTSLTLQVALVEAKQALQDAQITELKINNSILLEQVEFNAGLIEQLEAKVLAFSSNGTYSSVSTPLNVFCPFSATQIEGDLKVWRNLYIENGVYVRDILSPSGYKRLDININNLI
jgi:hypothetical protein